MQKRRKSLRYSGRKQDRILERIIKACVSGIEVVQAFECTGACLQKRGREWRCVMHHGVSVETKAKRKKRKEGAKRQTIERESRKSGTTTPLDQVGCKTFWIEETESWIGESNTKGRKAVREEEEEGEEERMSISSSA